jgi:hypothetical protein
MRGDAQWDFDPAALALEAINANLDASVFDQIDDSAIARPRNWFEWARDPRFLNLTPFPKQVEIATNLFSQFCPRCTDPGLMGKERWGNSVLSIPTDYPLTELRDRVSFLELGRCPKCGITKPELHASKELNHYYNMNGVAGMRCVSGDTLLFTERGVLRISEMHKHAKTPDTFEPISVVVGGPSKNSQATGHYYAGKHPGVHIKLSNGIELTGSRIHPVRVLSLDGTLQMKTLPELREGDLVEVVAGSDLWGSETDLSSYTPNCHRNAKDVRLPSELTPELGWLLGVLVGDGTYNQKYTSGLSVSNPGILGRFRESAERLFGTEAVCASVRESCECWAIHSVEVRKFLEHLGLEHVTSRSKRIPKCIMTAPRAVVVAFLSGIFDAGGCFWQDDAGQDRKIFLTTVSRSIAQEVQQLLLNLGVYSTVRCRPSRQPRTNDPFPDGRTVYTVIVRAGGSISALCDLLNLADTDKCCTAAAMRQSSKSRDVVPCSHKPFVDLWSDLRKSFGLSGCSAPRGGRTFAERSFRSVLGSGSLRWARMVLNGADATTETVERLLDATRGLTHLASRRALGALVTGRFFPVAETQDRDDVELFDIEVPGDHLFLSNGITSHNSSKTVMTGGLIATYQLSRFLLIPNPSRYFSLMDNQMLHMTFVAITAGQAYETLWQTFKDRVEGAPWFKEYHTFLTEEAARLGKDKEQLFAIKDSYVFYGHKQLLASYSGPDIRTIRGRTRFFTGIDEVGWFDVQAEASASNSKVRLNAYETHQALVKSLQTIRSASLKIREAASPDSSGDVLDCVDGINADVSSPASINDSIMVGLRDAADDPTILGFHYATWEMNPNVPLTSLRSEMRNKAAFERDYAAIPPLGANQFMSNQAAVEKCQGERGQNQIASWSRKLYTDDFGDVSLYLDVKPSFNDKTRPRLITVDTGLTNNSFAVAMWSYDREKRMPVCDLALEAMPDQSDSERVLVNFPMMFEHAILPLVTSFRVLMVIYDRWNSIDQVQRLRKDHKIEAIQYQLKWADFLAVRTRLLDSTVRIPKMEMAIDDVRKSTGRFDNIVKSIPATHLALQILTVREAGRKVVKPINGTDDLFRCMCLAVTFLLNPEYTKRFEQYGSGVAAGRAHIGVIRTNFSNEARSGVVRGGQSCPTDSIGVRKSYNPSR